MQKQLLTSTSVGGWGWENVPLVSQPLGQMPGIVQADKQVLPKKEHQPLKSFTDTPGLGSYGDKTINSNSRMKNSAFAQASEGKSSAVACGERL